MPSQESLSSLLTGPGAAFALGIVTLVICLYAVPICQALGLMDEPDDDRKQHEAPTPLIGGIAVLVPVICWCAALAGFSLTHGDSLPLAIVVGAGGAGLVGFADDQTETSPESRILLLLTLAIAALAIDPALVTHQINWFFAPSAAIPAWSAWLLATISLIGLTSAVNMADGIHGLTLFLYLTWAGCLTIVGHNTVDMIATATAATVLVTLLFNFRGGVFLGDSGAYGITFLVGLLTIDAHNAGDLPILSIAVWFCIPVLDCFRLMIGRLANGRLPWLGDYNHLHHRMTARFGWNRTLLLYIGAVATTSVTVCIFPTMAIMCLFCSTLFYAVMISVTENGNLIRARAVGIATSTNVIALDSDVDKSHRKNRE